MRYESPPAFRAALETRLAQRARDSGIDLGRLRRRATFERLLARLAAQDRDRWVLKGGTALEARIHDRARATRDLDLAIRGEIETGSAMRNALLVALQVDLDSDGFMFEVSQPRPLSDDEAGRPGSRFSVTASLAGRTFERLRVDLVARGEELHGTETLRLPGSTFDFAGIEAPVVQVINREQHFAEKLHAFTRQYRDRPNTRVKDLADLVILIDDGLAPSPRLRDAVAHVYEVRGPSPPPSELPDPPESWKPRFAELVEDLDLSASTVEAAMVTVRTFWATTLSATEEQ
ncbi:MAG: nucleotidyl transferase AbiEii/AbiGii toxin family protein [Acidimicrobiia bacterium]